MREECFGSDHILVANTLFQLGKLLRLQRSSPVRTQALQYLQRALDIRTKILGDNQNIHLIMNRGLSAHQGLAVHRHVRGHGASTRIFINYNP